MKSSFSGARVVQKDVVKLARKQVATVAAVSVPEGVTIEKMGQGETRDAQTLPTRNISFAARGIVARRAASPSRKWPATWITLGTVFFG